MSTCLRLLGISAGSSLSHANQDCRNRGVCGAITPPPPEIWLSVVSYHSQGVDNPPYITTRPLGLADLPTNLLIKRVAAAVKVIVTTGPGHLFLVKTVIL